MKIQRGAFVAVALSIAALVAAGCGSDSGASDAVKDSAALKLIPKDAIGYVTVDTDLDGKNWKQFDAIATSFYSDFKGVGDQVVESADGEGDSTDFEKDVKPWLGDSAGAAVLSAKGLDDSGTDPDMVAWIELKDRAKFESFIKDQEFTKGSKTGDFTMWTSKDDDKNVFGVSDDLVIMSPSEKALEARADFDGDSITDADLGDALDDVSDDALLTLVVSGPGLRAALKDNDQAKEFADADQLKDIQGMAVTFSAEDNGLRLAGNVSSEGDEEVAKNTKRELLGDLPASTLLAVSGHDFGGTIKDAADQLGKENADVQTGIGQVTAALGVDVDEMAKAFSGEFAFAVGASDEGIGGLVGGIAGAAMGGGSISGLDTDAIASAASAMLAFEETDGTAETLEKLVGAGASFAGATGAPKEGTAGDFATKTMMVSGLPVMTASSDDIAAVSAGADVFTTWGDDTLGDSDAYKDAWKAADVPEENAGAFWLDFGRIAGLAGLTSGNDMKPGGWVGWAETDGGSGSFGVFMHVTDK